MALGLTDVSVVPVASKNTMRGDMPVVRGMLALRVNGPLLPVQAAIAPVTGVLVGGLTVTTVDCCVVPPEPVQDRV